MLILAALAATLSATPAPDIAALSARLDEHPSLAALAVEAEARRLDGRSRLGLPNPSVALGVNNVPINDPLQFDEYLPSSKSVTVTQALPSRRLREARSAVDEARADVALTMMRMRRDQLEAALRVSLREIDAAEDGAQLIGIALRQAGVLNAFLPERQQRVDACGAPGGADDAIFGLGLLRGFKGEDAGGNGGGGGAWLT